MSDDAVYIAQYLQVENSTMSTEIEHLRKEAARLLIELDEEREISRRLANTLDMLFHKGVSEDVVRELLSEYFSSKNKDWMVDQ